MAYSKAYKVKNRIIEIIEKYDAYYDESVQLEPNTTYRFSLDYKAIGGTPSFSFRDIDKKKIKE